VPDEREERAYRFGPLERRGTVGGLRLGQAVTIGGGCVLSVLLLRVLLGLQAMPAAVLVLLIAGAAAILPISGRTPDDWLPVVAGTFTARLRGEHRYRARRASQGFTSALDGEALKRPQAMPPVPRGCRLLSAHLADGSELGMLHDPELGAYTAVVVLQARAVSLLPPAEHERRLEQWGQVLAALARRGSAIRRLQIIEHTAPSDGHLPQPAAVR
jgi:hypothetical protein